MKLVYFDEGSAADQLIMNNKGKLEVEGNTKLWGNASVSTEVGFGGFFSSIIKNLPKIKAEWQGEGQVNKVIEKRLTNALLFDYIDALKNAKDIKVFNDVKVRFAPNSLAQIQSLSPYMTMIDGSASIDEGVNIEYSKVDDTLKKGKGYYELLLDEGGVLLLAGSIV